MTNIAVSLLERADLGPKKRFRLAGIGLSNFHEAGGKRDAPPQPALFE
ncbi:MAG: hypothetical protein WBD45_22625 [Terriglobales bacterium]